MRVLLCGAVVGLALSPASAVASSNQVVQTAQPLESGCPKGAGKPPVRGSRCVPVPVSMIQDETSSASGCGQSVFMQVPLIKGIRSPRPRRGPSRYLATVMIERRRQGLTTYGWVY